MVGVLHSGQKDRLEVVMVVKGGQETPCRPLSVGTKPSVPFIALSVTGVSRGTYVLLFVTDLLLVLRPIAYRLLG